MHASHAPASPPQPEWPEEGRIEYRDVWMRYRPELDPVLRGGWQRLGWPTAC